MPFTLSHAAAVLPGVRGDGTGRGRLIPAVLVAGSFAPDLTYYAASVASGAMGFGDVTHSFAGVLTVDVLLAWVLVGVWLLVREPLVALLPPARRSRIASLTRCGVPHARVTPVLALRWYLSAALGSLTHVVWDAFTHLDRWGMRLFPVLGEELAGSPLYWYLQYGGSLIAAIVIVGFVRYALLRTPGGAVRGVPVLSGPDRWAAAAFLTGCAAIGTGLRVARWWAHRGEHAKPWEIIPTVCFGAGAGLVVGVVLFGVAVRVGRPVVSEGSAPSEDAVVAGRRGGGER
ncbi:DUF4184 family protein [Streptomyces sp. S6]